MKKIEGVARPGDIFLMLGPGEVAERVERLELAIGYRFCKKALLIEALTHPSERSGANNQRLEFLGDKVLGGVIADLLLFRDSKADEGKLTRQLTALVRTETLADIAIGIGIGKSLIIGKGADQSILTNKGAMADALEALIGALFKDGGYKVARQFIEDYFNERVATVGDARDYKTQLQELLQSRGLALPMYTTESETGPAHSRLFSVKLVVCGITFRATGYSKKAAEMYAAKSALAAL